MTCLVHLSFLASQTHCKAVMGSNVATSSDATSLTTFLSTFTFMHLADAFIQSDLQLHFRLYIFVSMCVPWESNPQPFVLLTQCSTTEPHRNNSNVVVASLLSESNSFSVAKLFFDQIAW